MSSCRTATATFNLPDIMPQYRTYCIIGQGRGGTSMTANLVEMLGVKLTKTNQVTEDVAFRKVVQTSDLNLEDVAFRKVVQTPDLNLEDVKAELDKRNVDSVWAWKIPHCGVNLPKWYKLIRNPFWIYILRDHMASALTEVRVNPDVNAINMLKMKCDQEILLHSFINNVDKEKLPILLISDERVRLHKGQFLFELIKFLGTNPSIENVTKATDFIDEEGRLQLTKM